MMHVLLHFLAALSPLLIGVMGAYVTFRPPSKNREILWISCFITFGITGSIANFLELKSSDETQQDIQIGVHQVIQNTSGLPRQDRALDEAGKKLLLSYIPNKEKEIKILVLNGDPERDNLGDQIAEFLKAEGYKLGERSSFLSPGSTPTGIVIDTQTSKDAIIIKVGVNK